MGSKQQGFLCWFLFGWLVFFPLCFAQLWGFCGLGGFGGGEGGGKGGTNGERD